jgi:hypothetical protein
LKPRMTLEQHVEMGRALAGIREGLQHRSVQIANAYPRSGREAIPARKLQAAIERLDEARSALENAMFDEHPDEGTTNVYYPDL